ncbi:MAG: nickel-dependent hydrogenase large subunit [Minicystis sp.]
MSGEPPPADGPRTIAVDYLARVEGESSLAIRLEGGQAKEVRLSIFEPPRFFEALLRGRSFREAPDITARICGICPVAYLMSACAAMEDALGIRVDERIRALRRLLYCGEWIESHALHVFLLHAPDFLGYPDAISMARDHRDLVQKGLAIKKAGNAIVARLGGREIHPVNVRVGGFYRAPPRAELSELAPDLRRAGDDARACLAAMAKFPFPDLDRDYELVAVQHPDEYPILGDRVVSSRGLDIEARGYDDHFVEEHVPWSTALRSMIRARGSYLCGPLSRFNLSFDRLLPEVQEAARAAGLSPPCRNPFRSLLVRLVEILQAIEESLRIIEGYEPPARPFVEPDAIRAGTGHGVTEAPRGLLYHRYTIDAEGTILDAKIVPPTSQNQRAIEEDSGRARPIPRRLAARRGDRAR